MFFKQPALGLAHSYTPYVAYYMCYYTAQGSILVLTSQFTFFSSITLETQIIQI